MSRSKREEQLKENERYPLRSLTTEQRYALKHLEKFGHEKAEQPKKDE